MSVFLAGHRVRQLPRIAAVGRRDPQGRSARVGHGIDGCDDMDKLLAVGADLRISNALKTKQVIEFHRTASLGKDGSREGKKRHEDQQVNKSVHAHPLFEPWGPGSQTEPRAWDEPRFVS